MTDGHDTPAEHFEADLLEAEHNVAYYESEIAWIKKQLDGAAGSPTPGRESVAGVIAISSISFAAGWLLGSVWGGKRKSQ